MDDIFHKNSSFDSNLFISILKLELKPCNTHMWYIIPVPWEFSIKLFLHIVYNQSEPGRWLCLARSCSSRKNLIKLRILDNWWWPGGRGRASHCITRGMRTTDILIQFNFGHLRSGDEPIYIYLQVATKHTRCGHNLLTISIEYLIKYFSNDFIGAT